MSSTFILQKSLRLWDNVEEYITARQATEKKNYVGYSESKYRLRISIAHPRPCHFEHVQWLRLSIQKPQTPFREIRFMFMFVPVR